MMHFNIVQNTETSELKIYQNQSRFNKVNNVSIYSSITGFSHPTFAQLLNVSISDTQLVIHVINESDCTLEFNSPIAYQNMMLTGTRLRLAGNLSGKNIFVHADSLDLNIALTLEMLLVKANSVHIHKEMNVSSKIAMQTMELIQSAKINTHDFLIQCSSQYQQCAVTNCFGSAEIQSKQLKLNDGFYVRGDCFFVAENIIQEKLSELLVDDTLTIFSQNTTTLHSVKSKNVILDCYRLNLYFFDSINTKLRATLLNLNGNQKYTFKNDVSELQNLEKLYVSKQSSLHLSGLSLNMEEAIIQGKCYLDDACHFNVIKFRLDKFGELITDAAVMKCIAAEINGKFSQKAGSLQVKAIEGMDLESKLLITSTSRIKIKNAEMDLGEVEFSGTQINISDSKCQIHNLTQLSGEIAIKSSFFKIINKYRQNGGDTSFTDSSYFQCQELETVGRVSVRYTRYHVVSQLIHGHIEITNSVIESGEYFYLKSLGTMFARNAQFQVKKFKFEGNGTIRNCEIQLNKLSLDGNLIIEDSKLFAENQLKAKQLSNLYSLGNLIKTNISVLTGRSLIDHTKWQAVEQNQLGQVYSTESDFQAEMMHVKAINEHLYKNINFNIAHTLETEGAIKISGSRILAKNFQHMEKTLTILDTEITIGSEFKISLSADLIADQIKLQTQEAQFLGSSIAKQSFIFAKKAAFSNRHDFFQSIFNAENDVSVIGNIQLADDSKFKAAIIDVIGGFYFLNRSALEVLEKLTISETGEVKISQQSKSSAKTLVNKNRLSVSEQSSLTVDELTNLGQTEITGSTVSANQLKQYREMLLTGVQISFNDFSDIESSKTVFDHSVVRGEKMELSGSGQFDATQTQIKQSLTMAESAEIKTHNARFQAQDLEIAARLTAREALNMQANNIINIRSTANISAQGNSWITLKSKTIEHAGFISGFQSYMSESDTMHMTGNIEARQINIKSDLDFFLENGKLRGYRIDIDSDTVKSSGLIKAEKEIKITSLMTFNLPKGVIYAPNVSISSLTFVNSSLVCAYNLTSNSFFNFNMGLVIPVMPTWDNLSDLFTFDRVLQVGEIVAQITGCGPAITGLKAVRYIQQGYSLGRQTIDFVNQLKSVTSMESEDFRFRYALPLVFSAAKIADTAYGFTETTLQNVKQEVKNHEQIETPVIKTPEKMSTKEILKQHAKSTFNSLMPSQTGFSLVNLNSGMTVTATDSRRSIFDFMTGAQIGLSNNQRSLLAVNAGLEGFFSQNKVTYWNYNLGASVAYDMNLSAHRLVNRGHLKAFNNIHFDVDQAYFEKGSSIQGNSMSGRIDYLALASDTRFQNARLKMDELIIQADAAIDAVKSNFEISKFIRIQDGCLTTEIGSELQSKAIKIDKTGELHTRGNTKVETVVNQGIHDASGESFFGNYINAKDGKTTFSKKTTFDTVTTEGDMTISGAFSGNKLINSHDLHIKNGHGRVGIYEESESGKTKITDKSVFHADSALYQGSGPTIISSVLSGSELVLKNQTNLSASLEARVQVKVVHQYDQSGYEVSQDSHDHGDLRYVHDQANYNNQGGVSGNETGNKMKGIYIDKTASGSVKQIDNINEYISVSELENKIAIDKENKQMKCQALREAIDLENKLKLEQEMEELNNKEISQKIETINQELVLHQKAEDQQSQKIKDEEQSKKESQDELRTRTQELESANKELENLEQNLKDKKQEQINIDTQLDKLINQHKLAIKTIENTFHSQWNNLLKQARKIIRNPLGYLNDRKKVLLKEREKALDNLEKLLGPDIAKLRKVTKSLTHDIEESCKVIENYTSIRLKPLQTTIENIGKNLEKINENISKESFKLTVLKQNTLTIKNAKSEYKKFKKSSNEKIDAGKKKLKEHRDNVVESVKTDIKNINSELKNANQLLIKAQTELRKAQDNILKVVHHGLDVAVSQINGGVNRLTINTEAGFKRFYQHHQDLLEGKITVNSLSRDIPAAFKKAKNDGQAAWEASPAELQVVANTIESMVKDDPEGTAIILASFVCDVYMPGSGQYIRTAYSAYKMHESGVKPADIVKNIAEGNVEALSKTVVAFVAPEASVFVDTAFEVKDVYDKSKEYQQIYKTLKDDPNAVAMMGQKYLIGELLDKNPELKKSLNNFGVNSDNLVDLANGDNQALSNMTQNMVMIHAQNGIKSVMDDLDLTYEKRIAVQAQQEEKQSVKTQVSHVSYTSNGNIPSQTTTDIPRSSDAAKRSDLPSRPTNPADAKWNTDFSQFKLDDTDYSQYQQQHSNQQLLSQTDSQSKLENVVIPRHPLEIPLAQARKWISEDILQPDDIPPPHDQEIPTRVGRTPKYVPHPTAPPMYSKDAAKLAVMDGVGVLLEWVDTTSKMIETKEESQVQRFGGSKEYPAGTLFWDKNGMTTDKPTVTKKDIAVADKNEADVRKKWAQREDALRKCDVELKDGLLQKFARFFNKSLLSETSEYELRKSKKERERIEQLADKLIEDCGMAREKRPF